LCFLRAAISDLLLTPLLLLLNHNAMNITARNNTNSATTGAQDIKFENFSVGPRNFWKIGSGGVKVANNNRSILHLYPDCLNFQLRCLVVLRSAMRIVKPLSQPALKAFSLIFVCLGYDYFS